MIQVLYKWTFNSDGQSGCLINNLSAVQVREGPPVTFFSNISFCYKIK